MTFNVYHCYTHTDTHCGVCRIRSQSMRVPLNVDHQTITGIEYSVRHSLLAKCICNRPQVVTTTVKNMKMNMKAFCRNLFLVFLILDLFPFLLTVQLCFFFKWPIQYCSCLALQTILYIHMHTMKHESIVVYVCAWSTNSSYPLSFFQ